MVLSNGTLFSKHLVQQKNATKRAPKWATAVNEMGTGQRPIISEVVALCRYDLTANWSRWGCTGSGHA